MNKFFKTFSFSFSFLLLALSMTLLSCDTLSSIDTGESDAFGVVSVRAMTGGKGISTVGVEFNEAIQKIDLSNIKIKREGGTQTRTTSNSRIPVKNAIFIKSEIFITVSSTIKTGDEISVIISPGTVESVSGETNTLYSETAQGVSVSQKITDIIAVPNSRYIFLIYDGAVSWSNKAHYELSSGNTVTEASVVSVVSSYVKQILTSNNYITKDNGIEAEDFANYIVQLTISKPTATNEELRMNTMQGAVTGIDGVTLSESMSDLRINTIEDVFPEFVRIEANSAANTRIVLVFDDILEVAEQTKMSVSINDTAYSNFSASINSNNRREVYITLSTAHAIGDNLLVALAPGAVQNDSGKFNAEASNTTLVLDKSGPILQSISANNEGSARTVILSFDDEIALVDKEKFRVTVNKTDASVESATIDETEKIKVLLRLSESFKIGDSIHVFMEEAAVTDIIVPTGNINDVDSVGKISEVFDISLPLLQSIAASDSSARNVRAVFNRDISALDSQKFQLKVNNIVQSVISAQIDTENAKEVILNIGTTLLAGASVQITLEAGAVSDKNVVKGPQNNVADTNGQTTQVVDETEPRITSIQITDKPELIIVFSETISIVDQTGFTVQDGSTEIKLKDVQVRNNTRISLIAEKTMPYVPGSSVSVIVAAGSVQDGAENKNIRDAISGASLKVADVTAPSLIAVEANDGPDTQPQLVLEFSENLARVSSSLGNFIVRAGSTTYAVKTAELGGTAAEKVKLTLATGGRLSSAENVSVSLRSGAVVDGAGNENITDNTGISSSVRDITAPELASVTANDGANTQTQLELFFNEALSQVSSDMSDFTVQEGAVERSVKTAVLGVNKLRVYLTLKDGQQLIRKNEIRVKLATGAVSDAAENAIQTTEVSTTVLDVSAPKLASVKANDGANTQTQLSLQFNEEIASVSTDMSRFVIKTSERIYAVRRAVLDSGKQQVNLTLEDDLRLEKDKRVDVTLASGAVADASGNQVAAVLSPVSATVEDVSAPVLTVAETTDANKKQVVVSFNEEVSVNKPNAFQVNSISATGARTNDSNKKKVILTLADDITVTIVRITLLADAVRDTADNKSEATSIGIVAAVQDVTAPTLKTVTANDGTNSQTQLVLEFSETLKSVSTTASRFTVKVGTTNYAVQTAELDTDKTKVNLKLTDGSRLPAMSSLRVGLSAGAVRDAAENENLALSTGIIATVDDVTAPTLKTVTANDGTNSQTQLVLEFSETLKSVSTTASRFTVKVGTTNYAVQTAELDTDKTKVNLKLTDGSRLPALSSLRVGLSAGAVRDAAENENLALSTGIIATVDDVTAPTLKAVVTANDGTNAKPQIVLTYNENLTSVSHSSFSVTIGEKYYGIKSATLDSDKRKVNLKLVDGLRMPLGSATLQISFGAVRDAGNNANMAGSIGVSIKDVTPAELKTFTANNLDNSKDQLVLEYDDEIGSISSNLDDFSVESTTTGTRYAVKSVIQDTDKKKINIRLVDGILLTYDQFIGISIKLGAISDVNGVKTPAHDSATMVADRIIPILKTVTANDRTNAYAQLVLEFSKELSLVSTTYSDFIIQVGSTSYNVKSATLDTNKAKVNLKLADGSRLPKYSTVKVTLLDGAVRDKRYNFSQADSVGKQVTIADMSPPEVVSVRASTAHTTQVQVTFTEDVSIFEPTHLMVNGVKVHSASVSSSADNVVLLTVNEFNAYDTLRLTMIAGGVQDSAGIGNRGISTATATTTTQVKDTTRPRVLSMSVDNETDIILKFDEYIQFPNASKFTVKTGSHTVSVSSAVNMGQKIKLITNFTGKGGNTVKVTLLADAVMDLSGNMNLADAIGKETAYRIITTEAELENIKNTADGTFKLLNNIALTGVRNLAVIGGKFSGELDGNNKTISNLSMKSTNFNYYTNATGSLGLFNGLNPGAVVKNLTIEIGNEWTLSSNGDWGASGALVGTLRSAPGKTVEITNVHVRNPLGTAMVKNGAEGVQMGGLIGYIQLGGTVYIRGSSITGLKILNHGSSGTGGIVGEVRSTGVVIEETYVKGVLNGSVNMYAGGMCGWAIDNASYPMSIRDSYLSVDIVRDGSTTGSNLGLLIGSNTDHTNVERVWVESTANDTKLLDNGNVTSATNVYSNVARGTGTGSAAKHTLSGTTLPTGFSSSVWEIKTSGARPTLKNNPE